MTVTRPQAQPLDPADCYRLLATTCVGRVVSTDNALPLVLPVNYCLDGHNIVFRTSPSGRLAAATHNVVVAFEVDEIDVETWTGWSVVVTGVASPLSCPSDLVRAGQIGLVSWLGEDRDHFVQIMPGLVTGRRLHVEAAVGHESPLSQPIVRTTSSTPTTASGTIHGIRRRGSSRAATNATASSSTTSFSTPAG